MLRLAGLLLILVSAPLAAQTIAFISDLNGRYGSSSYDGRVTDAIDTIVKLQPDLVICGGDMVAGQKQPKLDRDRLEQMWQGFNNTVADPLRRAGIPLAVTAGNHDGSAFPEFALERQQFELQWRGRVPEVDILPGSEWPRRYAARMGSVLLLAFDGTLPGRLPDTERLFLERMLQQYGNSATATIVFSHLPMWPLTRGREHEIIDDPDLLALLHRSGVDVYASGHHHAFFAGTDDAGMVHLGIGALGGNARAFSGTGSRQPFSFALLTLEGGEVSVTSRAAPAFQEQVPATQLPAAITGPLGTLRRMDGPVRLRP
jgi:predicted phosphodiesterase